MNAPGQSVSSSSADSAEEDSVPEGDPEPSSSQNLQLDLDISFGSDGWPTHPFVADPVAIATYILGHDSKCGGSVEISLRLTDDEEIAALNSAYRGKEGPTNVLSFEGTPPLRDEAGVLIASHHLGDIVMALQTLKKEAAEQGKDFKDHATHLYIHGLLHLLGYDHQEDEEAAQMEALEILRLEHFGIANPYQEESP